MPPRMPRIRPVCSGGMNVHTRWNSSAAPKPAAQLQLLQHHHLEPKDSRGAVSYDEADTLQETLRSRFLDWKSRAVDSECPKPNLITFESTPTYTFGRRQDDLDPDQTARLRNQLRVDLPHRTKPLNRSFTPEVRKTNRGGLTTYHGPGQIVFWPVLDMHSPLYEKYGVASYASHLESTTQRLLAETFGIQTYISREDPGVWVKTGQGLPQRKIAALGVHHRRYVTALGLALNIDIPVTGPEDINPWARFIPCGLEGKLVTSIAAETEGSRPWDLAALASRWATLFEEGLLDPSKRLFSPENK